LHLETRARSDDWRGAMLALRFETRPCPMGQVGPAAA
jgi:hypothetical protein